MDRKAEGSNRLAAHQEHRLERLERRYQIEGYRRDS